MIDILRDFLKEHLYLHIMLIVLCAAAMLVAMAVDLYFGVKKAKKNGEATTSTGFKKTCDKSMKYFMPFLCLICIDVIGSAVLPVPAFSMIWAAWCVFCEFKSVREKAWTKAELRKAERTVNVVVENKDDIVKMVAEMILKSQEEKSGKEKD